MNELSGLALALALLPLLYAVAVLYYLSQAAYWAKQTHKQAEHQSRCLTTLLERGQPR